MSEIAALGLSRQIYGILNRWGVGVSEPCDHVSSSDVGESPERLAFFESSNSPVSGVPRLLRTDSTIGSRKTENSPKNATSRINSKRGNEAAKRERCHSQAFGKGQPNAQDLIQLLPIVLAEAMGRLASMNSFENSIPPELFDGPTLLDTANFEPLNSSSYLVERESIAEASESPLGVSKNIKNEFSASCASLPRSRKFFGTKKISRGLSASILIQPDMPNESFASLSIRQSKSEKFVRMDTKTGNRAVQDTTTAVAAQKVSALKKTRLQHSQSTSTIKKRNTMSNSIRAGSDVVVDGIDGLRKFPSKTGSEKKKLYLSEFNRSSSTDSRKGGGQNRKPGAVSATRSKKSSTSGASAVGSARAPSQESRRKPGISKNSAGAAQSIADDRVACSAKTSRTDGNESWNTSKSNSLPSIKSVSTDYHRTILKDSWPSPSKSISSVFKIAADAAVEASHAASDVHISPEKREVMLFNGTWIRERLAVLEAAETAASVETDYVKMEKTTVVKAGSEMGENTLEQGQRDVNAVILGAKLKRLKSELRQHEFAFQKHFGRLPTRGEKALLRPAYELYHALKFEVRNHGVPERQSSTARNFDSGGSDFVLSIEARDKKVQRDLTPAAKVRLESEIDKSSRYVRSHRGNDFHGNLDIKSGLEFDSGLGQTGTKYIHSDLNRHSISESDEDSQALRSINQIAIRFNGCEKIISSGQMVTLECATSPTPDPANTARASNSLSEVDEVKQVSAAKSLFAQIKATSPKAVVTAPSGIVTSNMKLESNQKRDDSINCAHSEISSGPKTDLSSVGAYVCPQRASDFGENCTSNKFAVTSSFLSEKTRHEIPGSCVLPGGPWTKEDLIREKEKLGAFLKRYQEAFRRRQGRDIQNHKDILPVESEYTNFLSIRGFLRKIEQKEADDEKP